MRLRNQINEYYVKSVRIRNYSDPHFPACRKILARITPNISTCCKILERDHYEFRIFRRHLLVQSQQWKYEFVLNVMLQNHPVVGALQKKYPKYFKKFTEKQLSWSLFNNIVAG